MNIEPSLIIWTIVDFLILMLCLNKFLFKPFFAFLDKRKEKIEDGLSKQKEAEEIIEKEKKAFDEELKEAFSKLKQEEEEDIKNKKLDFEKSLEDIGKKSIEKKEKEMSKCFDEAKTLKEELEGDVPYYADMLRKKLSSDIKPKDD